MKMHSVLFAAAALSASALTVTVAAAPAEAAKAPVEEVVVTGRASDLPTAIVRYEDLNLASADGRTSLDRRVRTAARLLCGQQILPLGLNAQIATCHSAVRASAAPQIEALYAWRETGERLALGDVGALTLSAK